MYHSYPTYGAPGHLYPSTAPFPTDIAIPSAPITNPLSAGVQFGLLGAAAGLGYTGLRTFIAKRKPGGPGVVRDVLLGTFIGATFGALAARENQRRFPATPVRSAYDVGKLLDERMWKGGAKTASSEKKAAMTKEGIAFMALLPWLWGAMGAVGAAHSGTKAVKALSSGNRAAAGGHALSALGEGALGLLGAGPVLRIGKAIKGIAGFGRAGKGVMRVGRGLRGAERKLYGPHVEKGMFGSKWLPSKRNLAGDAIATAPIIGGEMVLNRAGVYGPRPKRSPMGHGPGPYQRSAPSSATARFLRSIPTPQPVQIRTAL